MVPNINKQMVSKNFSKSATTYDEHADVQKKCAEKLMDLVDLDYFERILEIGCGTGNYTSLLSKRYPGSNILAVDISDEMIKKSNKKLGGKNIRFEVSDAEHLKLDEKFDLITSNASFQWFDNLDKTFSAIAGMLSEDGVFCFSMYGPDTFSEFKEVLSHHFGERSWLSSSRFINKSEIEGLVSKYFSKIEVLEDSYRTDFFSIWDFMQNIKKTGSRGEGLGKDIFLGKYAIKELESTYIEKFGSIISTHHISFCRAQI